MGGQGPGKPDAGGWRDKGGAPGPQLPPYTRALLASTSTNVGGQGAAEAGTVLPSHLDCFGATKARRDGHLGPRDTITSTWGSGVG